MTTFKNLFESVYNEKMDNLKRGFEWELSKINNNDFDCYYNSRCDARLRAFKRGKITIEQFKKSIINCYEKDIRNLKEKIENEKFNFSSCENKEIEKIELSIEWIRSSTWGYNPHCNARIFTNQGIEEYNGTASGCGYDKASASIASALNQCKLIKKRMYEIKENYIKNHTEQKEKINCTCGGCIDSEKISNHDIFGYGSGYYSLPYFEGGVGVSSLCTVIENLGFKKTFENTRNKHFDFYCFEKSGLTD